MRTNIGGLDLVGKRIALIGFGISNRQLLEFLRNQGVHEITVCDHKQAQDFGEVYSQLTAQGVHFQLGVNYLEGLEQFDWLFLTPGLRKDLPQLQAAKAAGVRIGSEIMVFMHLCPAPIIGITGSSGKTTTTTLVGEILRQSGQKVFVGGNIGTPLINRLSEIEPDSVVVLELSSFQLQDLQLSPWIGAVLNVTPNHLDQHASMEEYVTAKEQIWRWQRPQDWTVLNRENAYTEMMAKKTRGQTCFFSIKRELSKGAFLANDRLLWRWDGKEEEICSRGAMRLLGMHNVENALAAIAISQLAGGNAAAAAHVLTNFRGVEHRLELVRQWQGVNFYNDSIATTPARTMAALRAFVSPVILIAGGYDKKLPFTELGELIAASSVKAVVLLGATAPALEAAIRQATSKLPITTCADLASAVKAAAAQANYGDVVLLSPACASFDMFKDFSERGRIFKKLVGEL